MNLNALEITGLTGAGLMLIIGLIREYRQNKRELELEKKKKQPHPREINN
jgi:hypothetical protein